MKSLTFKKIYNKKLGTKPTKKGIVITIDENTKIYDDEGLLIAIFLKNVLPKEMINIGRQMVQYKGTSDARGYYAGTRKKTLVKSGKHIGMTDIKGKKSNSVVLGHLMPYLVKNPKPQLSSATKKNLDFFNDKVIKLYLYYDKIIEKIFKDQYKIQKENIKNMPKSAKISNNTTNIQLNYNQVAHFHEDKGNANAYGSLTVFYPDGKPFKGGEFLLGNYGIAFNLKEGDFLYVNPSIIHGTLPSTGGSRLSCVGFQSVRLINYYNRLKMSGGGVNNDIVYVIPTYQRYKILYKQTLSFLERYNIPKKNIFIIVANQDEFNEYNKVIEGYTIIIGVLGLKNVIRFIQNYFPNGQKIFHINDDVRGLKQCAVVDGKSKMIHIKSLKTVVKRGFDMLDKNKLQLFGFYPLTNEMFACSQQPITFSLKFIVGAIYGYINDKSLISKTPIVLKEDYERSITSYLKYGGVLRFNHIGVITTYANNSGGVSALRKKGVEEKESRLMKKMYPDLVHFLNRKRVSDGFKFDISLKDKS
jgi:hypothetical protein